jgi:hypothetical protein
MDWSGIRFGNDSMVQNRLFVEDQEYNLQKSKLSFCEEKLELGSW